MKTNEFWNSRESKKEQNQIERILTKWPLLNIFLNIIRLK